MLSEAEVVSAVVEDDELYHLMVCPGLEQFAKSINFRQADEFFCKKQA